MMLNGAAEDRTGKAYQWTQSRLVRDRGREGSAARRRVHDERGVRRFLRGSCPTGLNTNRKIQTLSSTQLRAAARLREEEEAPKRRRA